MLRVAFTIIFNGAHHLRHHDYADRVADMVDLWVVVEGASANTGSTSWCRPMPDHWHKDGHSIDDTREILESLAAERPNVRLVTRPDMWPNKDVQVNAALECLRAQDVRECFLWQIDADEQWTCDQMATAEACLQAAGARIGFFHYHHWIGRGLLAVGHWGGSWWERLWHWQGEPFATHEPPALAGVTGPRANIPLTYEHYGYYFPQDVRFKTDYYGYPKLYENWLGLQEETEFPQPSNRLFAPDPFLLGTDSRIVRVDP